MISKDEISRYDRQIRLWGLDGQQKLSSAHICVLGVRAITVELLKNIVLAGVGSITVVDDTRILDEDLAWNYFIRADEIGMLRAPVTIRRAGALNPRVALKHDERPLAEIPDSFFEEFNVVIAVERSYDHLVRINDHTHARGISFYAAGLLGWGSYIFADLCVHRYRVKRPSSNQETKLGSVSTTRTIVDVKPDGDTEELLVEESYSTLRTALHKATTGAKFAATLRKKQLRQVSPYLPALLAYWESPTLSTADIEAKASALGLPLSIFTDDWTAKFLGQVGVELAATASVVGGYLAQEVINFLTQKDHPVQNIMIYDSYEGKGPVYLL